MKIKGTNRKVILFLIGFMVLVLLSIPFVRAEAPSKQDQYYRDMAKQHFDLAVTQFDNKDLFAACSNLRVSRSYARHINDTIAYDHLTLLLDKMCRGNS